MMKRALLLLNITIGCVIVFLIWTFNQLAPGGASAQAIDQLEHGQWAVVDRHSTLEAALGAYVACQSAKQDCDKVAPLLAKLEAANKPFSKTHLSEDGQARYLTAAQVNDATIQAAVEYIRNSPVLDAAFVTTQARMLKQSSLSSAIMVKELETACSAMETRASQKARSTQFVFVFMLLAIWAFSATFTEYVVGRK